LDVDTKSDTLTSIALNRYYKTFSVQAINVT